MRRLRKEASTNGIRFSFSKLPVAETSLSAVPNVSTTLLERVIYLPDDRRRC